MTKKQKLISNDWVKDGSTPFRYNKHWFGAWMYNFDDQYWCTAVGGGGLLRLYDNGCVMVRT